MREVLLWSSRVLSGPLWPSRVLSGPLWSSRALSGPRLLRRGEGAKAALRLGLVEGGDEEGGGVVALAAPPTVVCAEVLRQRLHLCALHRPPTRGVLEPLRRRPARGEVHPVKVRLVGRVHLESKGLDPHPVEGLQRDHVHLVRL